MSFFNKENLVDENFYKTKSLAVLLFPKNKTPTFFNIKTNDTW